MQQQPVAVQLEADFRAALNRIGFLPDEQVAIIEYTGCRNLAMLGLLSEEDLIRMCKAFRTRPINPIPLTVLQEKLLLGVRFWVSNRQRLQLPINADDVTPALAYTQANIRAHMIEDEARADREPTAKMPDKFKTPSNWKVFAEALQTYLGQLKGTGRIPLSYVIRRVAQPLDDAVYQTELEQSVALAPLAGPDYSRDNARVYAIIKQLVLEGPGRSYIMAFDRISDGRAAWLALVNHFEGDSYRNRNVEDAYAALERIHYEGERKGFNFEKFVEKHNEAYQELSRYGEPVLETKKVRDFLTRINAPELAAAKQQVRATPALLANFQEAANFIALSVTPLKIASREIGALDTKIGTTIQADMQSTMSPITQASGFGRGMRGRGRARGFSRGSYSPGRGRGRGREGRFGPRLPTSYYTPDQWAKLTPAQRSQVLTTRGTKRNISAVETEAEYFADSMDYNDPIQSYTDDGHTFISLDESPSHTQSQITVGVGAITTSPPEYENISNNAGDQFGQRSRLHCPDPSRYIGMVQSSPRIKVQGVHDITISQLIATPEQQDQQPSFVEFDSHADTSCAGANCRIIEFTDKVCSVSPFHPKYKALENIPIVRAATAYDDQSSGKTYMLVLNQCLYMGDALPSTLLNLNQARANGVIIDDVPRQFGGTHSIFIPQSNIRIPLQLHGVLSCLPVRRPTIDEIETCEWVELTSDEEWDPKSTRMQEQEQACQEQDSQLPVSMERRMIYPIVTTPSPPHSISWFPEPAELTSSICSAQSSNRKLNVSANALANRWGIGIDTASRTLHATTQLALRQAIHPIQRRFRTEVMQLRYPRLGGRHGCFYTDTFFSKVPSLGGHTMAQVYTNDVHFTKVFPLKRKADAPDSLVQFMQDVGIPSQLHSDDAKELTQGRMGEILRKCWIKATQSEPYSPWQVRAELCNRELKKAVRLHMAKTKAPSRLWDFCAIYHSEIRNLTAHSLFNLHGRTPYELVTGHTPDISEYLDYGWYDTVWYLDQEAAFPDDRRKLAKWLGIAHRVGQALCYYLLLDSGRVIVRSTVQPLSFDDKQSPSVQHAIKQLDHQIETKIVDIKQPNLLQEPLRDIYEPIEPEAEKPEIDDYTPETYDAMISADLLLPKGDVLVPAKVIARKHDVQGNPIGRANTNPILDSRVYEVQFPDGHVEEYSANILAENIYSQVDAEGNRYLLIDEILDHHCDETAVHINDKWIQSKANRTCSPTTKGWKLHVRWKDGSTSWEPLRNLKNSNPIELAEYAVSNKLDQEPAFAWWVPHTIKRRNTIIGALKTASYPKKAQKFGLEIPNGIKRALEIDKETQTDFWQKAIAKEMLHVRPAFNIQPPDSKPPVGSKWIPCHMIFDIKMDFTRKARFVAGGHVTDPPTSITYSSVVARDSVRLAFLIAALNNLNILSADIGNAYLNAPTKEKVHTTCGLEFGHNYVGCIAVITHALYGLKSSGAAWRNMFAGTLQDLQYKSSLADPDVWLRPAVKPNGEHYYEYIFVYVDDILVLSLHPEQTMTTLAKSYRLKDNSVAKPTVYLGAQIKEHRLPDNPNQIMWSMSAEKYLKEALRNLELKLLSEQKRLPTKVVTPLAHNYRPELDVSPLLDATHHTLYMQLVGILRWAVELGRVDIHLSVALMAQYLAQPRLGHLDQVYHIFAYIKAHLRSRIILDATVPFIDSDRFKPVDWSSFYPDAKEAIPTNAPESRGKAIVMSCFVDADHAGNRITRRSHTGIIIFCNRAPILWFSKRQNTVETSSFGSEFVAARIAVELIEGLRYKLRMFGIPIDGPTNVFCDNQSVVTNTTIPESTLKRKHNSIAYHRVREAAAAGTIRIAKESHETNIADMLTKPVTGPRLKALCERVLF